MIAKIAVSAANFAIDKPYSYRIPEDISVRPGQRVQLPLAVPISGRKVWFWRWNPGMNPN